MKKYVVLTFLLFSISSYACSCLYSEFGFKDYQKSTYVIDGKIVKITVDEEKLQKIITFQVRNTLKGNATKFIELRTEFNSAMCGLNVSKGDKWLLFVTEFNGSYHVGLCGNHVRYNKRRGESSKEKRKRRKLRKKMLKQLKEFKKPSYNEQ